MMAPLKQKLQDLVNKRNSKRLSKRLSKAQPEASGTSRSAPNATAPQATTTPVAQPSAQPSAIGIQSKAVGDVQATTDGTLQIALVNQSNSDQLYAYISMSQNCRP
jgi:hypothetical protein